MQIISLSGQLNPDDAGGLLVAYDKTGATTLVVLSEAGDATQTQQDRQ